MGTRADHQITPQLSVRYDYHGDVADRFGPVSLSMELHTGDSGGPDTVSFLVRSELSRPQLAELLELLQHAAELWDERERSSDGRE